MKRDRSTPGGSVRIIGGRWRSTKLHGRFDIVFLDPPFAGGLWDQAIAALPPWLADDAWLYVESPASHAAGFPDGWTLHREGRTRDVRYALVRRTAPAPVSAATD